MKIEFYEPFLGTKKNLLFRGYNSLFWKRLIFDGSEIEDNSILITREIEQDGFDFLIVFNPKQFFFISPFDIDKIKYLLINSNPENLLIITTTEKTFFIISKAAYKKLNININNDSSIIESLCNQSKIQMTPLVLENDISIFDIEKDLQDIEKMITNFQLKYFLDHDVILEDRLNFYIEGIVPIGKDTRISTGVVIKGDCKIGENVFIHPHCYIENSSIENNCTLLPGCIVKDSALEDNVQIGPYTHLRNGAIVKKNAKMGNFVEMKKSILGEQSKAMHLSYIGDAQVGEKVNIGAGTITCNYDGINKNKTFIGDSVFIGSGTELVAPITLQSNSYIAAGSTITEEVPEKALAVARQKQRNILEWVTRKKKKICKS